ncbi:transducin family protein / WD-40 repeat family protein [Salvia divinorum]|uniref:Transducin family protein / WD-40 repeat family protein n=1 Tax=Salvia divinorum TaxID=28513 RepID=A0ABD1HSU6_SALDI
MEWCIKSANRSASAAFSPDGAYVAAGTMAGAVDLQFSSSANLDLFELDFESDDRQMELAGSAPSSEKFNRLSWGKGAANSEEYPLGLIAGGLVDGSIALWNPKTLIGKYKKGIAAGENALAGNLSKHKGAVRGLEFNSLSPNLLASGAEEGDICIWDVSKPSEPSLFPPLKGSGSAEQGEISFLSWNRKVQHILASTSYNGTTVVWDLKKQKLVLSFSDSIRRRCSVLQWHPDIATQLIVASDEDSSPSLRLWDMRHIVSPVKEFVGHTKGVIAMSWCPLDSSYLLICAKDNRTICWDTVSGEIVAELPAGTNWNFDVHWYSKIPGLISASSFEGKVGIYNIEGCGRNGLGERDIGSAPLRAPKWYSNRAGVSFGFGGKLVSFNYDESSEVYVHYLIAEDGLVSRSSEFEAAIKDRDRSSLKLLCDRKSQESQSDEDRETWGFMKVMFTEDGTERSKLLAHLGFTLPVEETKSINNEVTEKRNSLSTDESVTNKEGTSENKESSLYTADSGEDFFNNLPSPKVDTPLSPCNDESVTGDSSMEYHQEMNGQEGSYDPSFDDAVQCALVVGDYKKAVALCISVNRLADALVISHVGGATLWEKTRDQYLKSSRSSYLKVVSAMVNNDFMSIAKRRPLKSWKESLALFCTFAQADEWILLCDTLAARLIAAGDTAAATVCYICAGNIDKAVGMWSKNLTEEHNGKSYIDRLQDLMEKTIVFALATGLKQFSSSLHKLVEKYAEVLASQGLLTVAIEYLNLLGTEELSTELIILRDRIAHSINPETETESSGACDKTELQTGAADESSYCSIQTHYPVQPYSNSAYLQQNDVQPGRFVPAPVVHFPPANTQPPPVSEQYQQPPTLASHLYPGTDYQPATGYGATPMQTMVPRVFMPLSNSSQLPSPATVQPPAAPPPTLHTVDTSNVPVSQKPVITTLTRLYNEITEALGGPRANPAKKREIEDNSRKLGALFAKLNTSDISKNAAEKLMQLCLALDKGDYCTALQIQVLLTTSDWDECNFWLSTLKRMMKTRQNLR